ncbi:MAG: hypothetical protein EBY62_11875 [Cellvibrionales bacterium]|nr:hypothetical protein [Cellvibrionales bacterium]
MEWNIHVFYHLFFLFLVFFFPFFICFLFPFLVFFLPFFPPCCGGVLSQPDGLVNTSNKSLHVKFAFFSSIILFILLAISLRISLFMVVSWIPSVN